MDVQSYKLWDDEIKAFDKAIKLTEETGILEPCQQVTKTDVVTIPETCACNAGRKLMHAMVMADMTTIRFINYMVLGD